MQTTIEKTVSVKGIGLHTGMQTQLTIHPGAVDSGIVFWRSDIGLLEKAKVSIDRIRETLLCTGIFLQTEQVMTIEHLLSALLAENIDNVLIEVRGSEIPIFDGSASVYRVLLAESGKVYLEAPRQIIEILDPIRVEAPNKFAELLPYSHFRVSFEIDHYNHPYLSSLPCKAIFDSQQHDYWHNIGRARTFGFMGDVVFMQEHGLAQGGMLSNAMIFNHEKIINKEGMRFPNEMVCHKILDAMGDLYTLGAPIRGEYRGYRSGHALNNQLVRTLNEQPEKWRWVEERQPNILLEDVSSNFKNQEW